MLWGYARVSKNDESQNLNLQFDALEKAGVEKNRIYSEFVSGKNAERPALKACLKALREHDILFVWQLDRLGRNLSDLINIVTELTTRNVGLKILSGQGAFVDTTSPHGRMLFNIFGTLAEYERALIIERTKAGLAAARARGRLGGRPKKLNDKKIQLLKDLRSNPANSISAIASILNVSRKTIYNYLQPPKNKSGLIKQRKFAI